MTEPIRLAVLVGSLRRESHNRHLALALERLLPGEFVVQHVRIDDLPLYNQDDDAHQAATVRRLKQEVAGADALLFLTPEYNRSLPGVLKNAIDHGSRPYGQSVWGGKPAGVVGMSVGAIGTALAQQHLRSVLAYLDVQVLGQPEVYLTYKPGFFTEGGEIADEGTRQFLQGWVDRYVAFVRERLGVHQPEHR